ncbi:tRNA-specific 2-thiouridylase [Desulfonatronum thiosulfatophilum]|uniref:tRNA-specific 2-thiouridylase MnmA n=1 Tax=Desulfonatronum thiosulfatophilum TaxID=617002 RepID=A0A1G6CBN7_9BACT|nr:tRNA 2-thiouridine(34) synthase MnmA [Desulfonatronum thiosulfatophilum]SDB30279.1 tRNA-specific 2-thiouridylase [Desulfonatronum thiosulfatophilum]
MTVAVAVSGGRDSLLALALLRRQERDLVAVHAMLASETDPAVLAGLRGNCRALGVAFQVLDLREQFEELVVAPYIQSYLEGRTPNPCVWCNVRIKFGLLLDAVREQGASTLATGHYARLKLEDSRPGLWRGTDAAKDQSYFLALLSPEQLRPAAFPLEDHHKQDVLPELDRLGLTPPLPGESQEVCFIADDYRDFLARRLPNLPPPGPIVLEDGRTVGRHKGLWRYTIGQRKGLDIAWSKPLYVLRKDVATNQLVVGERTRLLSDACRLESVNFLVPPSVWPDNLLLQTRYRQRPEPARLTSPPETNHESPSVSDMIVLSYPDPREPAASGQIGVIYSTQGQVLAGGVISS